MENKVDNSTEQIKLRRKDSRKKRVEYLQECDRRTVEVNNKLKDQVFNEHINLGDAMEKIGEIDKIRYEEGRIFCQENQERIYEYEKRKDAGEYVHELELEEFKIKLMTYKQLIHYINCISDLCKFDIATKDCRIFKMLMNYELFHRYEMLGVKEQKDYITD